MCNWSNQGHIGPVWPSPHLLRFPQRLGTVGLWRIMGEISKQCNSKIAWEWLRIHDENGWEGRWDSGLSFLINECESTHPLLTISSITGNKDSVRGKLDRSLKRLKMFSARDTRIFRIVQEVRASGIRALLSHKRAPEGFVMPELCLRHSPAQELSAAASPCQATAGRGRRMKAPAPTSTHTNRRT